jgi:predicted GNAT family acetyltransferase
MIGTGGGTTRHSLADLLLEAGLGLTFRVTADTDARSFPLRALCRSPRALLMSAATIVTNNTAAGRFEAQTPYGVATLKYVRRGDVLDLVHTVVPQEAEGQGIGAALANTALEYARAEGLRVIPTCPFVNGYLKRHREFADLVATD